MKVYIGVDPGKSGAIVGLLKTDLGIVVSTLNPFKDLTTALANIQICMDYGKCEALIENVHAFPTDGRSSAFKFGKNAGQWEGLLHASGIKYKSVVPHKWMSWYGEMPKNKQERKNHLKSLAQSIMDENSLPYKATLKNSDAFLISYFYLKGGLDETYPKIGGKNG